MVAVHDGTANNDYNVRNVMTEANCILCRNCTRYICEKTNKMVVMIYCETLGEFIDNKTATDPLAECDFYEYDCNDDATEDP